MPLPRTTSVHFSVNTLIHHLSAFKPGGPLLSWSTLLQRLLRIYIKSSSLLRSYDVQEFKSILRLMRRDSRLRWYALVKTVTIFRHSCQEVLKPRAALDRDCEDSRRRVIGSPSVRLRNRWTCECNRWSSFSISHLNCHVIVLEIMWKCAVVEEVGAVLN